MRVNVAEPTTSNAPTAWRTARWKLRSCRKTGCQSETRARKRVSNTAARSRLYLYQGSAQVHPSPIKMSKLQGVGGSPRQRHLFTRSSQLLYSHLVLNH